MAIYASFVVEMRDEGCDGAFANKCVAMRGWSDFGQDAAGAFDVKRITVSV